jgi:thioredoxin-like negative regulator of GroEL
MFERVLLLVGVAVALLVLLPAAVRLWNRRFLRRPADVPGPAVVAFTHPLCGPCRTVQQPALERLRAIARHVRVEVVDVQREPHRARRYGIFTVPATAVVDPSGRIAALNHGVADERRLLRQLGETSV